MIPFFKRPQIQACGQEEMDRIVNELAIRVGIAT
jgi:hypothetical protein